MKTSYVSVEGFDQIPQAFMDLFDGRNKGKMVVKVWLHPAPKAGGSSEG